MLSSIFFKFISVVHTGLIYKVYTNVLFKTKRHKLIFAPLSIIINNSIPELFG